MRLGRGPAAASLAVCVLFASGRVNLSLKHRLHGWSLIISDAMLRCAAAILLQYVAEMDCRERSEARRWAVGGSTCCQSRANRSPFARVLLDCCLYALFK